MTGKISTLTQVAILCESDLILNPQKGLKCETFLKWAGPEPLHSLDSGNQRIFGHAPAECFKVYSAELYILNKTKHYLYIAYNTGCLASPYRGGALTPILGIVLDVVCGIAWVWHTHRGARIGKRWFVNRNACFMNEQFLNFRHRCSFVSAHSWCGKCRWKIRWLISTLSRSR